MIRRIFQIIFICFIYSALSLAQNNTIGIIVSDKTDEEEVEKLSQIWHGYAQIALIPLDSISEINLQKFDILCYHRSDSAGITPKECFAGDMLKPYVKQGGNLILLMDGVRLLNEWQIEPVKLSVESRLLKDVGHGRAVGFRGYLEHPIYEDCNGGAYVWFSPHNINVRTVGFSNDDLPQAPGSKILGVEWVYIKYNENRKLVWETPLGKGKILAVGGYIHLSQTNMNEKIATRFTENILKYLTGKSRVENAYVWNYDTLRVVPIHDPLQLSAAPFNGWISNKSNLDHLRSTEQNYTWDLSGPQVLVMGNEQAGIEEVWMHPIMAIRDYMFGLKPTDVDSVIWSKDLLPVVKNTPSYIERIYTFPEVGVSVTEMIVADNFNPMMSVYYHLEGNIEKLYIKYASNLRLMWPYPANCIGTFNYSVSDDLSSILIHDPNRKFNVITNFSATPSAYYAGVYNDIEVINGNFIGKSTQQKKMSFIYEFEGNSLTNLRFLMTGGNRGIDQSLAVIREEQKSQTKIETRNFKYYEDFDKDFLLIQTDDSVFNDNYRWALIALDQMFCNTSGIGKSLFAGFATTAKGWNGWQQVSGRPGYAWYFGRDSEWMAMALNCLGNYEIVRDVLETLAFAQDPNGKIYHEYTTSGSIHYDAADATPLYIILMNQYVQQTGDIEFLKKEWPKVRKSIDYCFSMDTDGDYLIENTNQGHGWIEGGPLYGFHTTIYLAGVGVSMLEHGAQIAALMSDRELSDKCQAMYPKAYKVLNERFWNENTHFFNKGLWHDGTFSEEKAMLAAVPVLLGTIDSRKAELCIDQLSTKYYSTDWGVRMLPYNSELYNPKSYHYGSVWPLFTGWSALAEYAVDRNIQAFRHTMNNLILHTKWDYGTSPEVLGGDRFSPGGVCMHQGWSSSMALLPLYKGMLGLDVQSLENKLRLAPALPVDWNTCDVLNIPVGKNKVDMQFKRSLNYYEYIFKTKEKKRNLILDFSPKLPLGTEVHSVTLNGKRVEFETENQRGSTSVILKSFRLSEKDKIGIETSGAIGVMSNLKKLNIGDTDRGLKIPKETLSDNRYTLLLQGASDTKERIHLFNTNRVKSIVGATIIHVDEMSGILTLEVSFDSSEEKFTDKMIEIELLN